MKLSDLKARGARIQNGDWEDAEGLPGVRLKVRGLGSAAFRNRRAELDGKNNLLTQMAPVLVSPAEAERRSTRAIADALLIDWEGIEGEDGQPLPFDKDKAHELLSDPDGMVLRGAVLAAAIKVDAGP